MLKPDLFPITFEKLRLDVVTVEYPYLQSSLEA